MRICFVCCEYPPGPHGGIGTSTRNLARALVGTGHEVRVVGVYPRAYPAPDEEDDRGVRVRRLRRARWPWGWIVDRYRLFCTIARWARRGEIDLVDVPDYQGWAAGWPRLPVPVIARWCGSASCIRAENGRPLDRRMFRLERASLRRSDFACAKSAYLGRQTQKVFGLPAGPEAILTNPVDVPTGLPDRPRSRAEVVFAGTLNMNKGILPLIQAWPRVHEAHPEAELHVFGKDGRAPDGTSMRDYLRMQLDPRHQTSVHFHGHVDREVLLGRLATARAGVFPSYSEGFANAPLEAMACACPTIVSSRTSGPEIIRHGIDGLTVDPDCPGQIVEAILCLLADDDLARRFSEAGLRRVQENFSTPVTVARNEAFYRQCIDKFQKNLFQHRINSSL